MKTIHISTVCIDGDTVHAFTVKAPVTYHKNGLYIIPIPALNTVERRVFIAANYGYQVCLEDGAVFVYCRTQRLGKALIESLLQIHDNWSGFRRECYIEWLPWEELKSVANLRKAVNNGTDYWIS